MMPWYLKNLPTFDAANEGGSGGAPPAAPASIPAPTPTPTQEGPAPAGEARELEGSDSSMDFVLNAFDPMMSDLEEEDIREIQQAAATAPAGSPEGTQGAPPPAQTKEGTQPAAAPTPPPAPVSATPPVAQPSAVSTPPPQQAQQPPAAQAPVGEIEPSRILDQIAEGIVQQQEAFTKALAEQQYKLDPKELESLGFLPEQAAAISQLQAKVHVNVVSSMTQMMAKQLPVMVNGLLQAKEKSQQAENEFFTQWPQLRGQEKQPVLRQVMATYRQMNPQAKPEEFIKTTGAMACAILGIPLQQAAPAA